MIASRLFHNKTNAIPTCIHCRCAQNKIKIVPFVHSPEGKALVLTVHSRETRNFSRETRLVSRETRLVSRETRRVSRDGGNLHLSGTVVLETVHLMAIQFIFILSMHAVLNNYYHFPLNPENIVQPVDLLEFQGYLKCIMYKRHTLLSKLWYDRACNTYMYVLRTISKKNFNKRTVHEFLISLTHVNEGEKVQVHA